jgi:hypothetical protein
VPVLVVPESRIELRRGRKPQELVRIGTRGVFVGVVGGPLTWELFANPRRGDEAWHFLRAYASFDLEAPAGDLLFRGRGRRKPSPAEQRMILEWARQVAAEAASGRAGEAYGLLLAWHQAGASGTCEDLSLRLSGQAVATACAWEAEIHGQLQPAQLERIYGWYGRLQPFQTGGEPEQTLRQPGSVQTRLIFAGKGPRLATPAERAEIQSFAAALFAELAARRRATDPAAAPQPAGTASPAAQRLLLSPAVQRPPPEQVFLQFPEEPPPPPRPMARRRLATAPPPPEPPTPDSGTGPPQRRHSRFTLQVGYTDGVASLFPGRRESPFRTTLCV